MRPWRTQATWCCATRATTWCGRASTLRRTRSPSSGKGFGVFAWEDDGDWSRGNYSLQWSSGALVAYWQIPYPYDTSFQTYWSATGFSQVYLTPDGDFRGDNAASATSSSIGNASQLLQDRLVRLTLDKDGNLRMYSWLATNAEWDIEWQAMGNSLSKECEIPGYCGPYSICNEGACTCPSQFEFVDGRDKRLGCRRTESASLTHQCHPLNDVFVPVLNVNWPFNDIPAVLNITLADCQQQCLQNCDCQAVTSMVPVNDTDLLHICYLKKDALLNGRAEMKNIITYLRVGSGYHAPPPADHKTLTISLIVSILMLVVLCCVLGYFLRSRQRAIQERQEALWQKWVAARGALVEFTYEEIELMTSNFTVGIGRGGYGTVFKGQIRSCELETAGAGRTVAVKRLDRELSRQLEREFQVEVEAVGRIHHVHLVELLGYCADAHHRLLVYEYVEKGALDRILFREAVLRVGHPMLEWRTRFAVATQIARGLAYLHEDCSLRMIHCDVKPANILLDAAYCAKIADFGLLRTMRGGVVTHSHTTRAYGGTYGYVAPEIELADGSPVTNKVVVFSFGMVLLEIVSGRRNRSPGKPYFPSWAFPRLETGGFMGVVDPAVVGVDPEKVRRALRVAFWCVNERADARPSMRTVEQMLQGLVAVDLPVPRPAYFGLVDDVSRTRSSVVPSSTSASTAAPSPRTHPSAAHFGSVSYVPIGQSRESMRP